MPDTEMSIAELKQLEQKAEAHYREIQSKRTRAEAQKRSDEQAALKPIAERAHAILCRWNHTDGCAWGYEDGAADPWACDTHSRWLASIESCCETRRFGPQVSPAVLSQILDVVEAGKKAHPDFMFLLRRIVP